MVSKQSAEGKAVESLPRHLFHGMTLVGILTAFTFAGTYYGWLSGLESIGLDSLIRLHSHDAEKSIAIVDVTDEDYDQMFNSESPINKTTLETIICNVAKLHPAVIGVDFDISTKEDPLGRKFAMKVAKDVANAKSGKPSIVWPYLPFPGAARSIRDVTAGDRVSYGVPRFPRDSDGLVRRFSKEVIDEDDCSRWPTLPFQIYSVRQGGPSPALSALCTDSVSKPLMLTFSLEKHPFRQIDAASLINGAILKQPDLQRSYANSTIIIGGSFKAARDTYDTPVGELNGVDLVAYAVSTLHRGANITDATRATGVLVDLFLGLVILIVSYSFKNSSQAPAPSITILVSVTIAFLAPILCSFLVFHSGYYWLGFAPAILGAFLHISYDSLRDLRELEKELRDLKKEVKEFRRKPDPPPTPHNITINTINANQIGILETSESIEPQAEMPPRPQVPRQ